VDDVKAELAPDQLPNATVVREKLTQKLEQMLPANLSQNARGGGRGGARASTGSGCRWI